MKKLQFTSVLLLFFSLFFSSVLVTSVPAQETLALLSQKIWGGSGNDYCSGVAVDSSSNIYVTGTTDNFGAAGGKDVLLLKYNSSGSLSWQRTWGGSGDDAGQGVALDSTGNTYLTGYTSSFGAGSNDVFLLKFDSSGNLLWQRTWGGNGDDQGWAVAVDKTSGNIYLTGEVGGYPVGDVFLLKFDWAGTLLWQKTWGGAGDDAGQGVALGSAGNIYVTGQTPSFGAGMFDAFLLKYDSSGNLLWQRTLGGGNNDGGYGVTVNISPIGDIIYLAGNTWSFGAGNQDVFLLKFDSSGNLLWQRTWGGNQNEYDRGIASDSLGNIYLTGPTNGFGAGSNDVFLLKFDWAGTLLWQKTWGGSGDDQGWSVSLDSSGNAIVTGYVTESQPYDLGSSSGSTSNLNGSLGTPSFALDTPSVIPGFPSGTVSSPSGSQTYAGGQDVFMFKYGLPAAISFFTNLVAGSITFAGASYTNGSRGDYASGSYTAAAVFPSGYTFSGWSSAGGVALVNSSSNPTTVTITGPGSLTANFASATPPASNVFGSPSSLFYSVLGLIVGVVALLTFLFFRARRPSSSSRTK